ALADNLEVQCVILLPDAKSQAHAARGRAHERFAAAEVDRSFELRRIADEVFHIDSNVDAGRRRRAKQRLTEASCFEQRRIDPSRQPPQGVESVLQVALDLVEQRLCSCRLGAGELARELELDTERHEVLLDAVVKRAFDLATFGIGTGEKARSRRSKPSLNRGV